jgi:predicted GH43/DUF377 family glycosyl hydrolase
MVNGNMAAKQVTDDPTTQGRGTRTWIILSLIILSFVGSASRGSAQSPTDRTWTHSSQADFMAGERHNLDARGLDALGTPLGYDADPRGAIRLRSRPGSFTKHPDNPVFDVGEGDAWDNAVVSEAKVIFDGARFHLWYAARQRLETPTGRRKSPMLAGYATSPDGLRWTRHPDNPIMVPGPVGSPDANHVYPPYVLFDGHEFRMWYSAHDFEEWSINYAVSTDGAAWQKHASNPLMRAAHDGRWDENFISEPSVLWNGQRFEMWYNGGSERTSTLRVGYAWSDDGLVWHKWEPDEWILDVGPLGAWDDFSVARVHVLYDGERYQMFYEGHDATSWRVGYAWSEDGLSWQKYLENPILDLGPPGDFDSVNVAEPYVIFDGDTYWLYYSGYDGDKYRIGLATAQPIYEGEGTLVSMAVDGKKPTYWGKLAWTCRLPKETDIRLEVAKSDDGQRWADWTLVTEGSADGENATSLLELGLPASRYLRYRATLTTADPSRSPVLEEVVITEAPGDFSLEAQPNELTLPAGETGSYSVNLSPLYGFDEPVALAVFGLPEKVKAHTADSAVELPAEVSLSVSSDPASPAGTHPITIEAAATSGMTRTVAVNLILLAPTPTPTSLPTATPTFTPTRPPTATPSPVPTATSIPPEPAQEGPTVAAGAAGLMVALAVIGSLIRQASRARGPQSEQTD